MLFTHSTYSQANLKAYLNTSRKSVVLHLSYSLSRKHFKNTIYAIQKENKKFDNSKFKRLRQFLGHNQNGICDKSMNISTISDCTSDVTITSSNNTDVGELIGTTRSNCTISNCISTGTIEGGEYTGSLIEYIAFSDVKDLYTDCDITVRMIAHMAADS